MARPLTVNAAEMLRRPGIEKTLECSLDPVELGLSDTRFDSTDLVGVNLRLESLTDAIVVVGTISVPWHGACRRCLRSLGDIAVCDVDELYQTVVTNPEAFPIADNQLDLLPMVREVALLDAPAAPLCRLDCAGLCPTCGADLNETSCACEVPVEESRWPILDELKAHLDGNAN